MKNNIDKTLKASLPRGCYNRLGEIAGEILGKGKSVGYWSVYAFVNSYPNKPYNISQETFEACEKAANQILSEEAEPAPAGAPPLATTPVS